MEPLEFIILSLPHPVILSTKSIKLKELEDLLSASNKQDEQIDLLNQYSWNLSRLHPEESCSLAERAFGLSEETGDQRRLAISLKNMAHCLRLLSRFAVALEKGLQGLTIARGIDDEELMGDLLYVTGSVHQHLGNKGSAIKFYEEALEIKVTLGDPEGEAWVRNSIGDHLMTSGAYEKAREYFEQVVNVAHDNDILRGIGFYNLGEIHYNLGNYEQAKNSLIQGRKMGIDLNFGLMIAYCGALLGKILSEEGDVNAEEHLAEALDAAEKVGSRERMYDIHKYWYEHLKANKDMAGALEHFEQFHYLKEEVFNEANAEKVQNVQLEFSTKMLQREAELERKKREELAEAYAEIEKLSVVASKTNSGVIILDAYGRTQWVNEAYTRITGYKLEEIRNGQPGDILVANAWSHGALSRMREKSRNNLPFVDQIQIETKTGERRWIEINNTPILDDEGERIKQIEIIDDVTERVLAERELQIRNYLIEEQNKDITASIRYAKNIQSAILPSELDIGRSFEDHFVIYLPKDIVSGDFYWFATKHEYSFLVVADCTGHGVPGAFVSMMGHNLLNQIVNDENVTDPAHALEILDEKVTQAFTKEQSKSLRDGMDLIFVVYNNKTRLLEFSGAYRPLYLVRKEELTEFKTTKASIGTKDFREVDFEMEAITLEAGDQVYLFSDGFVDQFGGEQGKKFMSKRLKELICKVAGEKMHQQKYLLLEEWNQWKKELEQVDDVCMVAFKV